MSELSIVFTDLAELLGSAIAIVMIFPSVPLWAGVLITSVDVLLLLAFMPGNVGGVGERRGRAFEIGIAILVIFNFSFSFSFDFYIN